MEEEKNKYCCEKCNYITFDNSNFKKHLISKKHLGIIKEDKEDKEDKEYYCEKCNYKTYNKQSFDSHIQSLKHNDIIKEKKETIYKCDVCDIVFPNRQCLYSHNKGKKHLSKQTGIVLKPIKHSYQCCWCVFSHTNPQTYIKHILDCDDKPKQPFIILARLNGIKNQLKKLTDKDYPRYVSGDYISRDIDVIKEKTIFYENRLKEETIKYNNALLNPPKYNIEEIIKNELERNKCYKKMRDDEFFEMVNKIREESDSDSD